MKALIFGAVVGLAELGCTSSPPRPVDTCGPLASLPICAPEFSDFDLEFSGRIWGVHRDCSDSAAIQISVAELAGTRVGEANEGAGAIFIDPTAWSHPSGAGVTIGHEIGHVAGYEHDASNVCNLMHPSIPNISCGAVRIDGCEYVMPNY